MFFFFIIKGVDYVGQKFRLPLQSCVAAQGFDRLRLHQQSNYRSRCKTTSPNSGQGSGELHRHDIDRCYCYVSNTSTTSSSTGVSHSPCSLLGGYLRFAIRRSLTLRFWAGSTRTKLAHARFSSKDFVSPKCQLNWILIACNSQGLFESRSLEQVIMAAREPLEWHFKQLDHTVGLSFKVTF